MKRGHAPASRVLQVSQLSNSREFGNTALAGSGPSVWEGRDGLRALVRWPPWLARALPFQSGERLWRCGGAGPSSLLESLTVGSDVAGGSWWGEVLGLVFASSIKIEGWEGP